MRSETTLTFEFFGVLQRLAGGVSHTLRVARAPVTVSEALLALAGQLPGLGAELPRCACAIGAAIVPRTHALRGGDTLVLLPPVAGG